MATEATLPPDEGLRRICPRCRKTLDSFNEPPQSGSIARCPVHHLAFVEPHELASADGDLLIGATVADRFTILGRLGRGSMGSVYRARQEAMGRDVALKIVRRERAYDPETIARFEREARAISQLTSPHTITAFDFGEAEDGSWFLAMEMLEGETVGERLRRESRIDWRDAVRFTREALRSLAEAHGKGIIHRDLKPDNLFLARQQGSEQRELCKVLDFGIAKWEGAEDTKIDQLETQAGTVFGTPRYMSPEQAQGVPLDARSDLYSLGVLLYQMLAGRAPFVDDDAVVVMARHIKDEPPPLADVASSARIPSSVEHVVCRALAKMPDDRPQTADQMNAELERAVELAHATVSGVQPTTAVAAVAPRAPTSLRVLAFGALLVLLGVAAAALVSFARSGGPAPGADGAISLPAALRASDLDTSEVSSSATPESRENSSMAASPPPAAALSADVASESAPRKTPARARSAAPAKLPRKGNERYGRFD